MKRLLLILSLAFAVPAINAAAVVSAPVEQTTDSNNTQKEQPKQQPKVEKKDYKDAFLALVLEKAEKYSDAAEKAVSKAVDAAAKEAPILMEQFLVWRFIDNLLTFFIPFFLLIIFGTTGFFTMRKWIGTLSEKGSGYYEHCNAVDVKRLKLGWVAWPSCIASVILTIITLANLSNLMTAIEIKVAPRVYIVEQAIAIFHK